MEKECCQTETKKEKILLYVTIGLLVFAIAITIALIVTATKKDKKNFCETKTCLEAATTIVQNMDPSVDPCKDFYDYTCGNYEEKVISGGHKPQDAIQELEMRTEYKLLELLEQPPERKDPRIFNLVKDYFSSCMNSTQNNALGLRPLKTFIRELGGCPMLDGNWDENSFSFTEILIKFRKLGLQHYGIFSIMVDFDQQHPEQRIIKIVPTPAVIHESFINSPVEEIFYNLGVNISLMLGADRSTALRDFREVIELQKKFIKAKDSYEPDQRKMTVNGLQRLFSHIDWDEFLDSLRFPRKVTKNEEVLVFDTNYISEISAIVSRTDTRVIANILITDAVVQVIYVLDDNVDEPLVNIGKEIGSDKLMDIPNQKRYNCFHSTSRFFSVALAAMYIRKENFNLDSKPMVEEIFDNIQREIVEGINNVKWLQDESIEIAKNKIKNIRHEIGYPDALLHDDEIENYYSDITILKDQYFYNYLNLTKNAMNREYDVLTKPMDEPLLSEMTVFPLIRSLNYKHNSNSFEIFATYLERPYFDIDWPNYLNYGAIGSVIASYLMYVIDPSGRFSVVYHSQRDKWTKSSIDKYNEMQNCIKEQYENFLISLRAEKIFDIDSQKKAFGNPSENLDVSYAYNAYIKWMKKNKPEMLLPTLRLTNRQLFWIGMANTWCRASKDDFGPSGYSELYVLLMNSPDFAKDFNCPVGSNMNPKKC